MVKNFFQISGASGLFWNVVLIFYLFKKFLRSGMWSRIFFLIFRSLCVLECGRDETSCLNWNQARSTCLGGAEFYNPCAVQKGSFEECQECLEEANEWMNADCKNCFKSCDIFLPNGMETVMRN